MDDKTIEGMHHEARPLSVQHNFYLDFAIDGVEPFYEFFSTLRQAGPEDVVFLHINSPGGSVATMTQIIGAITSSPCAVIGVAEGEVSSAAAMIFFSCHGFQVNDYSHFLIHNGMGGYIGKPNDNLAAAHSHQTRTDKWLKGVLSPFFSKKEIKDIREGKEFYLDSDDVLDRLRKAEEKLREEEERLAESQSSDDDA